MSEVIEDFIRKNSSGSTETEAFDSFVAQDRIHAWVGTDGARRERLRKEFSATWSRMLDGSRQVTVSVDKPAATATARPAAPRPVSGLGAPRPAPRAAADVGRQLQVLCPTCQRMDVWNAAGTLECRACHRVFDDMLLLIPVKPVGPFTFVFGEGSRGWLTAGGIAAGLLALYGVLRWL